MKYVPYMKINEMEVMHSIPYKGDEAFKDGNGGDVYIYFEKGDPIFFFKTAIIDLNKLIVIKREGFTDDEIKWMINFCRNNSEIIFEMVKYGGVMNYA